MPPTSNRVRLGIARARLTFMCAFLGCVLYLLGHVLAATDNLLLAAVGTFVVTATVALIVTGVRDLRRLETRRVEE